MNNFFSHFIVSIACPFLHEGGRFIAFKISIIDAWQGSKHASGLNFRNFSIQFTLHQELNGCGLKLLSKRDWQNLKTLVEKNILRSLQLVNIFNLSGGNVLPEYKEREISRTSPGRVLLKLIYWNKSIQSINITVTTNEYQEQLQTMIKKIPIGTYSYEGEVWFQKSLHQSLTWMFCRELFGYCHHLQYLFCIVYVALPQYLLAGILSVTFNLYFFTFLSKPDDVFH